jgi:CheY-like chemotaxis protein
MDGALTVESEPGRAAPSISWSGSPPWPTPSASGRRRRRSPDSTCWSWTTTQTNRKILVELLQSWGLRPTAVASVAQALAYLTKASREGGPVPLVLTDSHMPDADGFALAAEIKRVPTLADAVVLMLTSGTTRATCSAAKRLAWRRT